MGCAAAWALSERGADVTIYEQFDTEHTRGSSHGRTRIFRLAYPEPHWVELAEEALAGWRELEQRSGARAARAPRARRALHERRGDVAATCWRRAASSTACSSADELHAHGVELPEGWVALWQPRRRCGARGRRAARVPRASRSPVDDKHRVESLDDIDAEVVVVTAGAWVTKLVPDLPLTVTRETVAYYARDGAPMPSVVELNDETRHHAMYALHDPLYGMKAGAHHGGHVADPDVEEPADPALVERISGWVRRTIPRRRSEPVAAETCLYTSTEDESFVLERRGRLVVGSACSGHGFKFAPAVGRRLADLALG